MASVLPLKIGSTLTMALAFTQDDGSAVDLTGYTLRAQVRDALNTLAVELAVAITDAAGGLASAGPADTSAWPSGPLRCDVRLADAGGVVAFSDTLTLMMSRPVTV